MTETLTMPSRGVLPIPAPARPRGVRRVLYESGYALSAFPIALVAFVVVLVDLALGVSLLILVGGILLISLGVMVARGFARFERIRMEGMLGRRSPTPSYVCARPGDGFWRRSLTPLKDAQSWLDVVWTLVGLVTGTLAFAVTLVWWAAAATGLTYWFWQRWVPANDDEEGLASLLGLGAGRTTESLANLAVGAVFLVTLPFAVRLVTTIHASLASVLLSSRAELQQEVARVEGGRDAARMAEAESLRRLERDIHDGPQQRLVRLSMDLGRARRQLEQDPERAAATIDDALAQTRATVAELRSLSRGIAPPLLVDRGLAAAIEEMLAQSVVRSSRGSTYPPSCRRTSRRPSTSWSPRRSPTSPSTVVPRRRRCRCWRPTARSRCGSRTTAPVAPTRRRASAWPACGSGSRPSTAPSTSAPRTAQARRSLRGSLHEGRRRR